MLMILFFESNLMVALSVNWKGKFKQIELGFFDFFFYVEKIEIM
jgi:hypothetical protein